MKEIEFKELLQKQQKQELNEEEKLLISSFERYLLLKNGVDISNNSYKITEKRLLTKTSPHLPYLTPKRYFMSFSILTLLLIGFGVYLIKTDFINKHRTDFITKHTKRGERLRVILPDSSVVDLNSESTISYPKKFLGNFRKIDLKGEAFFKISKNESKPFIVNVDKLKVTVLGTSFNIESYGEQKNTKVTLSSGRLKVCDKSDSVFLIPSQQAVWNKKSRKIQVKSISKNEYGGWKEGILSFDSVTLFEAIKKIERWYDVDFIIDPDKFNKTKFSGTFKNESLETILRNIVFINNNIKYDILSNKKAIIEKKDD